MKLGATTVPARATSRTVGSPFLGKLSRLDPIPPSVDLADYVSTDTSADMAATENFDDEDLAKLAVAAKKCQKTTTRPWTPCRQLATLGTPSTSSGDFLRLKEEGDRLLSLFPATRAGPRFY